MYKWFILTYLTRVLWGLVNICKAFMDMQHIKYHETAPSYLTCMTWKRMLVFLSISRFSFLSTSHNTETFSCLASPIFSCWTGTAKPELCSSQWFTLLEGGGGRGSLCRRKCVMLLRPWNEQKVALQKKMNTHLSKRWISEHNCKLGVASLASA